ncbi:MAG: DNA repair protein [Christensenellaceae bacterium]|nr:DNA repair protein [Christensenellaceae bacterium]
MGSECSLGQNTAGQSRAAGEEGVFFCIDMKTFYASVECAQRGLNPFETDLVVADLTRGKNALCLAISPKMKARGVKNRCRLSDIPAGIKYHVAPPRMQLYIEYAADIYALYLNYFAPEDIHVYSIDEAFIDVTGYLGIYRKTPEELARQLMDEIAQKLHIPSTVGIGTNLYLAKIALDITAKKAKDHMGYLDERRYREMLWDHKPITDFWQIAGGTARRLEKYGITTMRGVAACPEELLYRTFGINAELLIDHAWGRESCRMCDIKSYKVKSRSVSFSQILPRNYNYEQAKTVLIEMAYHGCRELMRRKVIAKTVWVGISYAKGWHPSTAASVRVFSATALPSKLKPAAEEAFIKAAAVDVPIRRLAICFGDVCDEGCEGYDLFTDWGCAEREKAREKALLQITDKYGKNAVLRGVNYLEGATQRERNQMIGGHRAGYDD